MNEAAVIKATFCDWKTVRTRGQLQLIFEVPLNQQTEVLTRLGAPMPDAERWCAIAVLNDAVVPETTSRSAQGRERYHNASEPQKARTRAAMLADDRRFWAWASTTEYGLDVHDTESAADFIRYSIGAVSRSKIAEHHDAYQRFVALETRYLMETGQMATPR